MFLNSEIDMNNLPEPSIVENHITLVSKLLSLPPDSDEARVIRYVVKRWNGKFPALEQIYIQMMLEKERDGTKGV